MATSENKLDFRNGWLVMVGLIGLALIYIFQQFNYGLIALQVLGVDGSENMVFIVNKTLRLLANDTLSCVIIFSIFNEKKDRQVAVLIFLIELLLILPVYLLVKLTWEGSSEISSPLLSFIHRLIVNPTLMIMTGIALAYQKFAHPNLHN